MKQLLRFIPVPLVALALLSSAAAQRKASPQPIPSPLVRLLESKGLLTEQEAAMISEVSSPAESEPRLAKLLLSKGVISQREYEETVAALTVSAEPPRAMIASAGAVDLRVPPATGERSVLAANVGTATAYQGGPSAAPQATPPKPPAPKFIPAVAPLRVLPITTPVKDGLVPDIKLGTNARIRPYGFFKTSAVQQTASHGGRIFGSNDFPQGPLLLGDTGPDGDPQVHVKTRQFRAGLDFEWPDVSKNLTLTGKLEFDFEGNFTNVNNRNISANRSSQPSLRLAWVRLDSKLGGKLPWFAQFGQDWSVFGSSTLMDLFETTGFGFAQGNLYERMPMFRTGVQFGRKDFKVQPEFAMALSSFGEPGLDVDQRTRFGGRAGPESNQPEVQARLVFQFPLSRAPGVVPAQIIFSYDHAQRAEVVEAASLPAGRIRAAFPSGLRLTSNRNAWSAETQLPTPYVTFAGKYYRGGDLRYYFMGQFNDVFTDLGRATPLAGMTATSFAGRVIPFGDLGGQVVAANLEPVMGQGGFGQLGFPLSRIFGADPDSRQAGWTLYLTYGIDTAFAKDAARANGLRRTDHGSVQIRYRFNRWASFVHEETYLDTRTARGQTKPFRGIPARQAHAWRSEFGPIFTF